MSGFVEQRLERGPGAARAARTAVRDLCGDRLPVEGLIDIELVVSELATNAVTHGEGEITLTVKLAGDRVTLSVLDGGGGRPQLRHVGTGSGHGRGLALVARLADDWQVREPRRGRQRGVVRADRDGQRSGGVRRRCWWLMAVDRLHRSGARLTS